MVLPNGRPPRLDLLGINPYTERRPNIDLPRRWLHVDINDLDWLVRRIDQIWPGQHVDIFVAEFGWLTDKGNTSWLWHVSRAQQATDLTAAFRLAADLGRVDTFCWFLLRDQRDVLRAGTSRYISHDWRMGLEQSDGAHKPSYDAFKAVPSGPSQLPG
jgi:hypothetical protein